MKSKTRSLIAASRLPLVICLALGSIAPGATVYWDGGTTNISGNGDSASAGGSGTWNATIQNWDAGVVPHVAWTAGNNAVFAGSGGTVTLGSAISAGNISISNNNYVIATDSGALTLTGGITTSGSYYHQITGVGGLVISGAQSFNLVGGLRISTPVSGSGTITKTGTGFFSFSNNNTGFTGKVIVNQGSFGINGDGALGAVPGSVTADSITLNGGTLVDGIVSGASGSFDNGGIFTINANRGITLGSSGGTIQVGYGSGGNMTVAGIVAGTGALTKTDSGTLTLTGTNTYSGGTTISAGTLAIGNNSALGTGTVTINDGGTLANNSSGALTVANAFTLSGASSGITFTGSQNLTLNGSISSSAAVKVTKTGSSVLTLTADNSGTLAASSTWNVSGGNYNSSTGLYDNVIALNSGRALGSATGSVLNLSGGTLRFTANGGTGYASSRTINVLSGGGSIDDGGYAFGEATSGGGTVNPGVTIASGANLSLVSSNKLVLSGVLSGSGSVTKFGTGTLVLSGNSTYSGGTTIGAGSTVTGARGLGSGVVTVSSGGTLSVSQTSNVGLAGQYFNVTPSDANFGSLAALQSHLAAQGQPALALNTTSLNFGTSGSSFPSPYNSGGANFEGYYSGMLNIGTAGTYTFNTSSDDGSVLFVDGTMVVNNNYFQGVTTRSGSIALTAGMHNIAIGYYQGGGGYGMTAQISGANNTTMVDLTTGNAQITPDLVIGSLAGAGSVALTTGNLILGQDNTNQAFSGVISGIGGVNKWGTGTETFTGANTYTGITTISGGTLQIGDGTNGHDGSITGTSIIDNSTLAFNLYGGKSYGGVISGSGGVTKSGAGTLTLTGANTYTGRTSVAAGTLTITAGGISGGTVGQTIVVNDTGTGTATMTQSGGTVSNGSGEIWIGQNSGSTGTYNLSGGTLNASNWLAIGRNYATGTLNITSSGVLSHTGSQHVTIGSGGGGAGTGTVNQTGGSFTAASEIWLGEAGTATYNISGGTVNANGGLRISQSANPGTLNLQSASSGTTGGLTNGGGGETFSTTTLVMSQSTGASTVNLDGGTLIVTQIASAGGSGTKTFNFNGGTLKAGSGANATFMTGLSNAFVKSGGAAIDTNGQTVTIGQALLTDVTSTGGGLTKNGNGTLTLGGANTYTGGTTLSGGTLAIANNSALGTGALTMNNGTTLANIDSSAHTLGNNLAFGSASGMAVTFSTSSDLTLTAGLSGASNGIQITKQGTGTLTIPDIGQSDGSATAPAIWTVTGGGTLALTRGNNLGTLPNDPTTQVILDNGTFKTITSGGNFFSQRMMQINAGGGTWLDSGGGVNFDGAVSNSGTFTINTPVTTATTLLNGAVSGSGNLVKAGAGTLAASGASTYTGTTSINAGTLNLTGSLGNTAISVASGAIFNPTQNVTAGLSSGSAGASLALASGAIFDMTSASAGTINTFALNPGSNTYSGQALSLAGANLRFDLGGGGADMLQVNSGTASVSGMNNIRITTGSSLTAGTYTLIGDSAGGLTGNFEFDGGSTLSVPALSQIRQVGGTFYRLTLQNSGTAEQVAVSAAPSNVINIMPLGSSITEGYSAEGATYTGGGYRSQLYQSLVNDGRFTPNFVGSNTVLDNSPTAGYNVLTGANQLNHEGHGGYTTTDVMNNLSAGAGWLATGNGVNPDYVTLSIGGNDYGASNTETTGPLNRTDAIVSQIESLRPGSQVILANLFYRTQTVGGVVVGDLQNTYYNPLVPSVVFNHVLAGQHVTFYDAYNAVTPGGSMTNISDGIHPTTVGYNQFASGWYDALANGSAYWTGGQDNQWSTVTGGNATNFAQNYQLTTPRQIALGASTDVYFNNNTASLATTLGQNISVRSLNFAAGATGAVTVGGANTLTLGAGGITVQAGTGAHVISADVALGANQTWGNVSSNSLTVSGAISGAGNLTFTGSYSIQVATGVGNGTTAQTGSGTGAFVLTGANSYTGSTTISSGTLQIGTGGTTGSLSTSSTITDNGALVFNRSDTVAQGAQFSTAAITGSGSLTQAGTGTLALNAANTYTGATNINAGRLAVNGSITSSVTVNNGGTLGGNGTITGNVTVKSGGAHAIGSSPGLATVSGNVSYQSGSIFSWDLAANLDGDASDAGDTGTRGTSYDAVNIGGNLNVAGDAVLRVVRNSGVDFTNSFWKTNQTWNDIFNVTGTTSASWLNTAVSVYDTSGGLVDVSHYGSFSVSGTTLSWTAVPEPSGVVAGLLLVSGLLRRRRKNA